MTGISSDSTSNNSNNHAVSASSVAAVSSSGGLNSNMTKNDSFVGYMSMTALEHKLKKLKDESQTHSQVLTQKLAESQSGQNLLHMSTRLSMLPPSLHSLLQQLHPVLSQCEQLEKHVLMQQLEQVGQQASEIRTEQRRIASAAKCADLWADLLAAEQILLSHRNKRNFSSINNSNNFNNNRQQQQNNDDGDSDQDVCSELERAAHIAQYLTLQVQQATMVVSSLSTNSGSAAAASKAVGGSASTVPKSTMTALPPDTERAGFVLQLAPRIRKVEGEVLRALAVQLEQLLRQQTNQNNNNNDNKNVNNNYDENNSNVAASSSSSSTSSLSLLLDLGAVMRGLMVLGRGKDVERIFARVAVLPLLNLSMGRLDEGGARGECAGLTSWLDQVGEELCQKWGKLLAYSLVLDPLCWSMDLLTAGVWVPLATTLTTDIGIQMAIFSPGIASILQANYTALDRFLAKLAERILAIDESPSAASPSCPWEALYYQPPLSTEQVRDAQVRIYAHVKTQEFGKKWNLPIYYQLRFGECCTRLNRAVEQTTKEGWIAQVYTGTAKIEPGFELSLFLELYDVLLFLWRPDVLLRPLTNRFLRGSTQLIGRVVAFCKEGMEGTIRFGDEGTSVNNGGAIENGSPQPQGLSPPAQATASHHSWSWGESEKDVAAVSWELTILESAIRSDYVETVCKALEASEDASADSAELRSLVSEVLNDTAEQILPVVDSAWNDYIVKLLTAKCSAPLAAVKGVAATYRMTNRPPPTQASPFVATVLRPLKEFDSEFAKRTPDRVGSHWKQQIVVTIADRYAAAVEELLATVQRTEVALSSRRARRVTSGGMSDGEKVKLQVYLDYERFLQSVSEVGVDPATVIGLSKLRSLTAEGGGFSQK